MAGLRVMISALQLVRALRQARDFHRALDVLEQLLLVDRLGQEAERAALRRLDRVRNRAMRREQQHAQPGSLPLDLLQQCDAVHVLHAQIGDDEIRPEARQRRKRFGRALDGFDVVALGAQANAEQAQQTRVVVDQQDASARALWLMALLWICTIFPFPNRSLDIRDRV